VYTLHIANKNYSSWSLRPWVLLSQLQIPFEEKLHVFNQDDFSEFSPTALVPCLYDGDRVVWESLAIIEYVAEVHPQTWPWEKPVRTWARCATAEMHAGFSMLRDICPMSCGVRVKLKDEPPALLKDIQRLDQLWREGLNKFGGPFLAGSAFTAVDAFYAPMAFRKQTFGFSLSDQAESYVTTLLDLPAMKQWYEQALAETWRDESHDKLILERGEVTQDFRVGS
jgi:glutathione S-transferase